MGIKYGIYDTLSKEDQWNESNAIIQAKELLKQTSHSTYEVEVTVLTVTRVLCLQLTIFPTSTVSIINVQTALLQTDSFVSLTVFLWRWEKNLNHAPFVLSCMEYLFLNVHSLRGAHKPFFRNMQLSGYVKHKQK